MKQQIVYIVFLWIGICIGGGGFWLSSHIALRDVGNNKIKFEKLLKYSKFKINKDRFHCEGNIDRDVSAVIGSIFDSNDLNVRNKVSFECSEKECTLMISNCKPWQSDSCGSRFLRFELNDQNEIDPSTFECIDVP